jgi:hypothetical protein
MADAIPFIPVKLVCGVMACEDEIFERAMEHLIQLFGPVDQKSPGFAFDFSDYYEKQMGGRVRRMFLSFAGLVTPEILSTAKLQTNTLEEEMRLETGEDLRVVNLDPGILSASALVMATAKDFAHRVPLKDGIYAHLEFLFSRDSIRTLEWTYPDFRTGDYDPFFLDVRRIYLQQLKSTGA